MSDYRKCIGAFRLSIRRGGVAVQGFLQWKGLALTSGIQGSYPRVLAKWLLRSKF